MKKVLKISLTLLLLSCILLISFQTCSEASVYSQEMQGLIKESEHFTDASNSVDKVNNIVATIITSIRIVGVAVAVVMLLVLAMKYMSAAPGDKADIKKGLINYVIGAVVFFGVVGILEIISQLATAIK